MATHRVDVINIGDLWHADCSAKSSPFCQCPDRVLLNLAIHLGNRADINSLVCSSRHCYRALNKFLYRFVLGEDNRRSSALLWACCLSKYGTARKALQASADPNAEWPTYVRETLEKYLPEFEPSRSFSARNAMYVVASLGDIGMAKLLIDYAKADFGQPVARLRDLSRKDLLEPVRWEDSPMISAISMGDHAELLHHLLQVYGDGITDLAGSTILTLAVREKRSASIRAVLRDETYTDPLGADNANGLLQAVFYGDAGLVRLILAKSRSDPNVIRHEDDDSRCLSGIRGQTPLAVAVCHGHDSVVRVLCADPRVNINLAGPNYRTPFFYAVRHGRWDIADILYQRGAAYDAELVFEQACVERRLDWMLRLIRVTEFNEYRLQDWHEKAYGHLKTCLYWLQVGPELDKRRQTYAKNWATGQSPAVNEASDQDWFGNKIG